MNLPHRHADAAKGFAGHVNFVGSGQFAARHVAGGGFANLVHPGISSVTYGDPGRLQVEERFLRSGSSPYAGVTRIRFDGSPRSQRHFSHLADGISALSIRAPRGTFKTRTVRLCGRVVKDSAQKLQTYRKIKEILNAGDPPQKAAVLKVRSAAALPPNVISPGLSSVVLGRAAGCMSGGSFGSRRFQAVPGVIWRFKYYGFKLGRVRGCAPVLLESAASALSHRRDRHHG